MRCASVILVTFVAASTAAEANDKPPGDTKVATTEHYTEGAHVDFGLSTGYNMPYGAVAIRAGVGVNRVAVDVGVGAGLGAHRGGVRYGAMLRLQPLNTHRLKLGAGVSRGPYKAKSSFLWGRDQGWEQVTRLNLEVSYNRLTSRWGQVSLVAGAGIPLASSGCYDMETSLLGPLIERDCTGSSPAPIPYVGLIFRASPAN